MYRSVKQIVEALHTGKTSLKSMRNAVSRYRKLGNLECVIMYMIAIETYLMDIKTQKSSSGVINVNGE